MKVSKFKRNTHILYFSNVLNESTDVLQGGEKNDYDG